VILVTGATGRVGYHVMAALADAHADVTAMVRVEAKAADLPGTPRHVVATFDDPPPAEVLRGFDRVFLLSPAIEEQAELETVFIDALVAAGHGPHVVKIAADGFADPGCEVRFMLSHRQVAAHLDATGLPVTFLAPALYMEGLLAAAYTIRDEALISVPAGHGRVGFVAAGDVAAVAARVLTSPGHEGAAYTLTGPEALGFKDVAARISAVFAREVGYTNQRAGRARELMLAGGHGNLRGLTHAARTSQQVLHVQGRGQVGDREAGGVQVPGDLPVADHEPHLAAGIGEAVRRDLDHVRGVARGHQRVDEYRLQLGLLLDRRAEQEDPVEAPQHLGGRRVVEGRHHVPRRPRQVGGRGLHPHHGRDVGARVGERLHQVVADPPGRSGHQYHDDHPIAPGPRGLGIGLSGG